MAKKRRGFRLIANKDDIKPKYSNTAYNFKNLTIIYCIVHSFATNVCHWNKCKMQIRVNISLNISSKNYPQYNSINISTRIRNVFKTKGHNAIRAPIEQWTRHCGLTILQYPKKWSTFVISRSPGIDCNVLRASYVCLNTTFFAFTSTARTHCFIRDSNTLLFSSAE